MVYIRVTHESATTNFNWSIIIQQESTAPNPYT